MKTESSRFLTNLKKILNEPEQKIQPPPFIFEPTLDAAQKKLEALKKHGMSLRATLEANKFSTCSLGSEFRPVKSLQPIFERHPKWRLLKSLLENGAEYPMVELEDKMRQRDLDRGMIRGNHSGASIFKKELEIKFGKDIENGWMLPLPPGAEKLIPHAEYCPTSIIEQMPIDDMGTFIEKRRPIHDQSFTQEVSHTSVNSRVHKQLLDECIYGHMLSRVIHYILALRWRFPQTRILISKADLDSAYRRAHVTEKAAAKTITWFQHGDNKLLLMCLRLIFGESMEEDIRLSSHKNNSCTHRRLL